jgi:hypothetical protein
MTSKDLKEAIRLTAQIASLQKELSILKKAISRPMTSFSCINSQSTSPLTHPSSILFMRRGLPKLVVELEDNLAVYQLKLDVL